MDFLRRVTDKEFFYKPKTNQAKENKQERSRWNESQQSRFLSSLQNENLS